MALIEGIKIDNLGGVVKDALGGIGQLFKDIRTAITGKEPLDQTKQLEIQAKLQEIEQIISNATISVALAEASSTDKWTSRSRPIFMYVIYILIISSIPYGIVAAFSPVHAEKFVAGFAAWLNAIPDDMWWLFGAGYLGYGAFRSFDKYQTCKGGK